MMQKGAAGALIAAAVGGATVQTPVVEAAPMPQWQHFCMVVAHTDAPAVSESDVSCFDTFAELLVAKGYTNVEESLVYDTDWYMVAPRPTDLKGASSPGDFLNQGSATDSTVFDEDDWYATVGVLYDTNANTSLDILYLNGCPPSGTHAAISYLSNYNDVADHYQPIACNTIKVWVDANYSGTSDYTRNAGYQPMASGVANTVSSVQSWNS